jgi:hypothetical protein
MELTKSREATERPSDDDSSPSPSWGRQSSNRMDDSMLELHDEIVERAWLLKTEMRWVRDDRNPLNAFRWFVWERFGTGDPPSRAERAIADEVTTVTAASVPILPNLRLLRAS